MQPRNLTRSAHVSHGVTPGPVPGALTSSRPPAAPTEDPPHGPRPPKLLDQVRLACRLRHLSDRTEEAYVAWTRRYILFHNKRRPAAMAAPDVASFLSSLATDHHLSASTQKQALSASYFLYRVIINRDLDPLPNVVRARTPLRLPVVLSVDEGRLVLAHLHGTPRLVALLLYGAGLRLSECLDLRVKDVDFARNQISVRQGKGRKDRQTVLPIGAQQLQSAHLEEVRRIHNDDLRQGFGRAVLPDALAAKFPNADRSWSWQFVFPASRVCRDTRWGEPTRFHLHESVIQRAVIEAVRAAGLTKRATCHSPFVRDTSAGKRLRHPHRAGTAGASRCRHDDDPHARLDAGRTRCAKPGGRPLTRGAARPPRPGSALDLDRTNGRR